MRRTIKNWGRTAAGKSNDIFWCDQRTQIGGFQSMIQLNMQQFEMLMRYHPVMLSILQGI